MWTLHVTLFLSLIAVVCCYNVRQYETEDSLPAVSRHGCHEEAEPVASSTCLETWKHSVMHKSDATGEFLEYSMTASYEPHRWRIFHLQNGPVGIQGNATKSTTLPKWTPTKQAVQDPTSVLLATEGDDGAPGATTLLHIYGTAEVLRNAVKERVVQMQHASEQKHILHSAPPAPELLFVGRDQNDRTVSHKLVRVVQEEKIKHPINPRKSSTHLVLEVQPVHIREVYRHAHVTLNTNILPSTNLYTSTKGSVEHPMLFTEARDPNPLQDCPFYAPQALCNAASVVANAATAVVHVATDVAHAAVAVYHVATALATGSLSESGSMDVIDVYIADSGDSSSSYYSGAPTYFIRPAIQVGGLTITANATFEVVLQYHFLITDYTIENITAILTASLEAAIDGEFDENQASTYQKSFLLGTVKFDPITLDLVVPVIISPSIPITAGASVMVKDSVSGGAAASMQAFLTTGVIYTPGLFQPIHNLDFNKQFTHHFSESVTVGLNVWIMPTLVLDTDYFGGPFFGLKVTAQLLLNECTDADNPSSSSLSASSSSTAEGVALSINVNLLVAGTLGAKLAFHHFGLNWSKTFGPAAILNLNVPLYQNTIQLGGPDKSTWVSRPLLPLGYRLRRNISSDLGLHLPSQLQSSSPAVNDCPGPTFPYSSYIGQSLFGVLSVNPGNSLQITSGFITMNCLIVTSAATPFYPNAVAVHFSCTLSASYVDANGMTQFFSQQTACTLRDSDGGIVFEISSLPQLNTLAFANYTSADFTPSFSFSFSGSPGDSCDVTQFVLSNDDLGTVTITGGASS